MREEEEEEEEVSLVLQVADRQSSQMENLLELFPFDHSPKRALIDHDIIAIFFWFFDVVIIVEKGR